MPSTLSGTGEDSKDSKDSDPIKTLDSFIQVFKEATRSHCYLHVYKAIQQHYFNVIELIKNDFNV